MPMGLLNRRCFRRSIEGIPRSGFQMPGFSRFRIEDVTRKKFLERTVPEKESERLAIGLPRHEDACRIFRSLLAKKEKSELTDFDLFAAFDEAGLFDAMDDPLFPFLFGGRFPISYAKRNLGDLPL